MAGVGGSQLDYGPVSGWTAKAVLILNVPSHVDTED
jgi:hypothetical protein